MQKDALARIAKFKLTAAAKKKPAKSKTSLKQKVRKQHDKIEDTLDRLAKKYKVTIKFNRNKNKLPSVVITGLKNLKYGEFAALCKAIPNSSPVPQKMNNNSVLFRIFAKRKVTASDDAKFVVTATKNGKRLYWTDEGFKQVKASDASVLDEETADKIERRSKAKGWASKSVPATMTAEESYENEESEPYLDDEEDTDSEEEDTGDEYDADVLDLVKFMQDNNIQASSLQMLADKTAIKYAQGLIADGPVEDLVAFIYDINGLDETRNAIRALANKQSM